MPANSSRPYLGGGVGGGVISGFGFLVYALVVLVIDKALRPLSSWLDARLQAPGVVETAYRICVACGVKGWGSAWNVLPRRVNAEATTTVPERLGRGSGAAFRTVGTDGVRRLRPM